MVCPVKDPDPHPTELQSPQGSFTLYLKSARCQPPDCKTLKQEFLVRQQTFAVHFLNDYPPLRTVGLLLPLEGMQYRQCMSPHTPGTDPACKAAGDY